jgi:tetratricopeptide (TPR) repeat protein
MDDITLIVSDKLEYHYSFISINKKRALHFSIINRECLDRIELKREVSQYYFELVQLVLLGKHSQNMDELHPYLPKLEKLLVLVTPQQSDIIVQRIYSSFYFYYLLVRDFENLLSISEKALDFFITHSASNRLQVFMGILRKGVAYLFLKDYENSRISIEEVLSMNPTKGTLHWNSAYSYSFTLEMLTKNYQKATDILIDMITDPLIDRLENIWIQQWTIRSAYIHFLAKIGYVDLERTGKKRVPNFRLGKFLNEVPTFSKDKRGLNIAIIIGQIVILLADNKRDQLYDKIEALSKYSYRHLHNDNSLRSNCMIRMILALVKADYNPIRGSRYAEKYVERLYTTQMNFNEYSTDIEIIPYEHLWDILLELVAPKSVEGH